MIQKFKNHFTLILNKQGTELSEKVWNGRFRMYFPSIPDEGPYTPTDEDQEYAEILYKYVSGRNDQLTRIDDFLSSGGYTASFKYELNGYRYIKMNYTEIIDDFQGVE